MTLQACIALVMLSLSAWSALALLLDPRGPARVNRRFALVIILLCVPQAYFFTQSFDEPAPAALLGLAAQAAIWLKGPLLLSMTRLLAGQPMSREWRHYLAFPPAFVGMALTPRWTLEWGLAGSCSLFSYLLIAVRDLRRARSRLAMIRFAYPDSAYGWLMLWVAGLVVLADVDLGIMAVAYFNRALPVDSMRIATWLVAACFIVLAFCSVYRPRLLLHQAAVPAAPPPIETGAEKSWRELDEPLAEHLSRHLAVLMEREQLFRQHDLSLADLAARLGVSTHQASELLDVYFGQSFPEYINGWRLWHASQMLADPRCAMRAPDVAFEAGFGDQNSFHRSFREAHGMTPMEFRKARGGGQAPATTLVPEPGLIPSSGATGAGTSADPG